MWVRAALEANGMSESDVTLVPLPFPAQGEAVKSGKVDVGMFPQPFAAMAEKDGLRVLFSSKTGVPFEEELILLISKEALLKKNSAAVKDLLADLDLPVAPADHGSHGRGRPRRRGRPGPAGCRGRG